MNTYSDIASFASSNDLCEYNKCIDLMRENKLIPGYESHTFEIYKGVGNDYGYDELLSKIIDAFVDEYGDQTIEL